MNNKPRRVRSIQLTAASAAAVMAAAVMSGGYALASSSAHPATTHPATSGGPALRYIDGTDVSVPAFSVGMNATKCPRGMYPIGGGPSSPSARWLVHWSDPDRSTPSAAHPNEWTVSMYNDTDSTQVLKVFVVCSTATSVTGNY